MSVDFEPVRVGGRRRRKDALAVTIVVVAAIAVAIVKPWDRGRSTDSPVAVVPTIASPSALAAVQTAISSPTRPATPTPEEPDFWEIIGPIVGGHEDWGVIGVVADAPSSPAGGPPTGLAGPWAAGTPTADGDVTVALAPGSQAVYLLGLTFPADDRPTDIRFWRIRSGGDLEWIDVFELPRGPAGTPKLFVPIPRSGSAEPWAAGDYRIDVLHRERVDRLSLRLADAQGEVPTPTSRPIFETGLVASADSDPSNVRAGLFATVDGRAVPFNVTEGRPLDETGAWMVTDSPIGGGRAPDVASAFQPRATGLGVMLTPHASVNLAVLRRLAPSPLEPAPPARGGVSGAQGRTPYVVFAAPEGAPMPPGVYAVSVSWTDGGGVHAATWHVELRPGRPIDTGP